MKRLSPKLKRHGHNATFISKDIQTTPKVFLRQDAPTGALQPPYDGPYEVLNRGENTFKIRVKGKAINVSIDRLKPAYTLTEDEDKLQPSTEERANQTRAGRTTKPPVRFSCT